MRLRDRLTYANVTATTALFIALGGTSYAAVTLPRDSVGARQLRSSSVRSAEVSDRTLQVRDLSLGARGSLRGPAGPQGPAGGAGASGGSGGGGGGGAISLVYKSAGGSTAVANEVTSATATCDAGQRVTGGGVRIDTGEDASARESYPNLSNTAWTAHVANDAGGSTYTVFAICTSG